MFKQKFVFLTQYLAIGEDSAVVTLHDPLYKVVTRLFVESLLLSGFVIHRIEGEMLGRVICLRRVPDRNLRWVAVQQRRAFNEHSVARTTYYRSQLAFKLEFTP